jgi:lipoprotein-anchoring transpeptidase ErfK/SrfK
VTWLFGLGIVAALTWFIWPEGETSAVPEPIAEITIAKPIYIATPPVIDVPEVIIETTREETKKVAIAPPIAEPVVVIEESTPSIKPIPLAATTSVNLEAGMQLLDNGQYVAARMQLSNALRSGTLTEGEEAQARGVLTDISDTLVFSPHIDGEDQYSIEYIIRGGDTLSGIVHKMGLQVDWRFIQRINGIKQASGIRPGQNLKLVTGPFHAIIHKDTYRIDIYLGDGDEQVFVHSYRVGLGEYNSTPTGLFKVRKNSKLVNPTWINPRTREFFSADNPDNPIGERWVGLQGIEERTKDLTGLGIHGTIEPQTIGTQASMGCVRMHAEDVTQIYEMLSEGISTVEIR